MTTPTADTATGNLAAGDLAARAAALDAPDPLAAHTAAFVRDEE